MRILVGGVGYRNLRDGSVGPYVADKLASQAGDGIEVEDISYHPVGLSQNLEERDPYDRVVFVSAVRRGREPGTVEAYRWSGELPPPAEVQARVAEAVTGVISLDNHLIVCGALGGLPDDVRVVEIEPADEEWGEEFSPIVAERLPELLEAVWTSTRP
jgi:hydrogenase maturation protease